MLRNSVCHQTVDVLACEIRNYKDYNTSHVTDVMTFSLLWHTELTPPLSSCSSQHDTFLWWFSPLLILFPSSWKNTVKSAKLTVMFVMMTYIDNEMCSSLSGLTKKRFYFTVWWQNSAFFTWKWSFRLSLSIDYFHIFSELKSHGPEVEGCDLSPLFEPKAKHRYKVYSAVKLSMFSPFDMDSASRLLTCL